LTAIITLQLQTRASLLAFYFERLSWRNNS